MGVFVLGDPMPHLPPSEMPPAGHPHHHHGGPHHHHGHHHSHGHGMHHLTPEQQEQMRQINGTLQCIALLLVVLAVFYAYFERRRRNSLRRSHHWPLRLPLYSVSLRPVHYFHANP